METKTIVILLNYSGEKLNRNSRIHRMGNIFSGATSKTAIRNSVLTILRTEINQKSSKSIWGHII